MLDLSKHPELSEILDELREQWRYEFDTEDNRDMMNHQMREIVNDYIKRYRDGKIDEIIN